MGIRKCGRVWVELGRTALDLSRDGEGVDKMEDLAGRLALAEKEFAAARDVLAMRAQVFLTLWVTAWRRPENFHFLLDRAMTQCTLARIRVYVSHFRSAWKLRQKICLPRPIWSLPREQCQKEMAAQAAVLETAARTSLPVRRVVSV
jgi:hypothetical protein